MNTEINYNKVINTLNRELKKKYESKDFTATFPEFEYNDSHHYFKIEKISEIKTHIKIFNMSVYYSEMYNDENDQSLECLSNLYRNRHTSDFYAKLVL